MPAVGNHEYLDKGPEIYRQTFDLPRNGPAATDANLVYSFEYADAFVAVLDSTAALFDPIAAQRQASLARRGSRPDPRHLEVCRVPPPDLRLAPVASQPATGRGLGADLRQAPRRYGPDRPRPRLSPVRADAWLGSPATTDTAGTVYVVAVSGEKFYGQTQHDFTARGLTHVATYQTIDVEVASHRLRYRSFDRAGTEVDALTIAKSPPTPLAPAQVATTALPTE